jgi:hypothetical protein
MGTLIVDQGIMTLVTVATIVICASLALFVLYTVIWHAVRRGLREYHHPAPAHAPRRVVAKVPDYLPSDWA